MAKDLRRFGILVPLARVSRVRDGEAQEIDFDVNHDFFAPNEDRFVEQGARVRVAHLLRQDLNEALQHLVVGQFLHRIEYDPAC